jgi:hypothetical protein
MVPYFHGNTHYRPALNTTANATTNGTTTKSLGDDDYFYYANVTGNASAQVFDDGALRLWASGFSSILAEVELNTIQFKSAHYHSVITDFAEFPGNL